jgi:hypothetical protein
MPVLSLLNVPGPSASNIAWCKAGMDLAKAKGADGVRIGLGVGNHPYSNDATTLYAIDTTYITQAIAYANTIGLGYVQILFGYGPKITQSLADKFQGGTLWTDRNRPPRGTAGTINGVAYLDMWDWIGRVLWQQLYDACDAAKGSVVLLAEKFNEVCWGGVGGPSSGTVSGTIEPGFWDYAEAVDSVVDWGSTIQIGLTLEGDSTTPAQTEINGITGATAISYWSRQDRVHTNRYAQAPTTLPYSSSAMKAQYSARLGEQLTRMSANAIIGALPQGVSEMGIRRDRCPTCQHPNNIRNDLVAQCQLETLTSAGLYNAFNVGGNPASGDFQFYSNETATTPITVNGQQVALVL